MLTLDEAELGSPEELMPMVQLLAETIDALRAHVTIVDRAGRIVAVNESWRRLVLEHDDTLERAGLGEPHASVAAAVLGIDSRSAESAALGLREVLDGTRVDFELEVASRLPGGERFFCLRVSPLAGNRAVVVHEDVTARTALAREARQRSALLDNLHEAIVATRPDWSVTTWSRAAERIFGWSTTDVVDRDLRALVLDGVSGGLDAIERELARAGQVTIESTLRRRDGSFFRALGSLAVVRADDGTPIGTVAVFRDNTELAELRAEMHQAQKMEAVGRLAAAIAHDFNNLLMGLSGVSDLGLRRTRDPVARSILAEVKRATAGGSEIVEQLMAFVRRDDDPRTPSLADGVVRELLPMLQSLVGEEVRLAVDLDAPGLHVALDAGRLRQVVMNLAINARDAMPDGGTLRIATSRRTVEQGDRRAAPGEYVRLTVEDDGIGMDEATRGHVFEPFFTTKAPGSGTGLGLSTVYGIVGQCNGKISLHSALGQGTLFHVDVPVAEAPALEESKPTVEAGAARPTVTVLLIEDEALVRMTVRMLLEDAGYTVFEAASGDEIDRVLDEAGPIDLVLSDMVLPGLAGPEVVRRVRARYPDVPAVYMSAYPRDLLIEQGKLSPEDPTLHKPFDEMTLDIAIRAALSEALEPAPAPAPTPTPARAPTPERARPPMVLLVEDYQLARGAMRELLEDEGYEVLEAASLQDARALASEPIDLLLTDLGLGDGRGDVLADELRRAIPGLGVLYVTGQSASDKRVQEALSLPRTKHLQKPVDLDILAAAVQDLLRG